MTQPPKTIGVAGAGTMGAGIAQLACLSGARTLLHDPVPEALPRGIDQVKRQLDRGVERGRLRDDEARRRGRAARSRAEPVRPRRRRAGDRGGTRVARDQARAVRPARRRGRLRPTACSPATPPRCSSPRSPPASRRPERVVGMHFFNPAPVMRLLEVVAGGSSRRARRSRSRGRPARRWAST